MVVVVGQPQVTINGVGVPDGDAYYDRIKDESSLVAYWPLTEPVGSDKRVVDTHGGRVGTAAGSPTHVPVAATPYANSALQFDGAADYVNIPYEAALNPTNFSVEAWVYRDADSGVAETIFDNRSSSFVGFNFYIHATSDLLYASVGDGAGLTNATSTSTIPIGQWTHVACSFDGTVSKVYINGVLEATGASVTLSANASGDVGVGARAPALGAVTNFLEGKLAHVALYNAALTDTQINSHYSAYAHAVNKLAPVGYWRLNEPSGTNAADLGSGDNDGVYTNTPTLGTPGALPEDVATSTYFDQATDEYVNMAYDASLNPALFTYGSWFKTSATGVTQVIVSNQDADGADLFGAALYVAATNKLSGAIAQGSTTRVFLADTGDSVTDGEWYFAAMTFDGTKARLYLNGVLVSTSADASLVVNDDGPFRVAAHGNSITSTMTGEMQDAVLYAKALSADDLLSLYNIGKQTYTNTYDKQVLALDPVAYWPLDEASGTTAVDKTGNGYDLTHTNTPTLGAAGGIVNGGTATSYAVGSTEYSTASYAAAINPSTPTVAAWVKSGTTGSNQIIASNFEIDTNYYGFSLSLNTENKAVFMTGDETTSETYSNGTVSLADDVWHFIAATHDGTTQRLYVDGVEVDNDLSSFVASDAADPRIGSHAHNTTATFDGEIQGVALYDRALSADEIAYLYSLGKTGK